MKVEQMSVKAGPKNCAVCGYRIKPGQMYLPALGRHVSCPLADEVKRAKRVGREP